MTREDYDRYIAAFNARDYDAVFDFYAGTAAHGLFRGRNHHALQQLRDFYGFLHQYVKRNRDGRNASPEATNWRRWKGSCGSKASRDLTREVLDARGMQQFFPIAKGDVQEMRQYIHYHLKDGKIASVGCALVP